MPLPGGPQTPIPGPSTSVLLTLTSLCPAIGPVLLTHCSPPEPSWDSIVDP